MMAASRDAPPATPTATLEEERFERGQKSSLSMRGFASSAKLSQYYQGRFRSPLAQFHNKHRAIYKDVTTALLPTKAL